MWFNWEKNAFWTAADRTCTDVQCKRSLPNGVSRTHLNCSRSNIVILDSPTLECVCVHTSTQASEQEFLCACEKEQKDVYHWNLQGKNVLSSTPLFKASPVEKLWICFRTAANMIKFILNKNCGESVQHYNALQWEAYGSKGFTWLQVQRRPCLRKKHPGGVRDNDPPHRGWEGTGISRPATSQCQNKPRRNASQGFTRASVVQQHY